MIEAPASTLDYFPTIVNYLDYKMPDARAIDGVDLMPIILGKTKKRSKGIAFCKPFREGRGANQSPSIALIDDNLKFMTNFSEDGKEDLLFELAKDPSEQNNIIAAHPKIAAEMREKLKEWVASCRKSHAGKDYDVSFTPVNRFPKVIEDRFRR